MTPSRSITPGLQQAIRLLGTLLHRIRRALDGLGALLRCGQGSECVRSQELREIGLLVSRIFEGLLVKPPFSLPQGGGVVHKVCSALQSGRTFV
ncbi:hypothetical protein Thiowin_03182 [Thiorhodovibrio winogradskyi]|uniref:Uncharacterized protein n=1 Tax=Thiorhodovibrio winogradskyi TaxID=77007 RepID=A0ABZ0SET0_9GAMM